MTERITDLNDPRWEALFTDVSQSWFRLETLQEYDVDYETNGLAELLTNGNVGSGDPGWQALVRGHVTRGRNLQRVHVVREPLSDYLRYELAVYELNSAAGEEIRILPIHDAEPPNLAGAYDFWIFDDRDVWTMTYDQQGRFSYADQATAPAAVTQCQIWRNVALAMSIPLADYLVRTA